MIINNNLDKSFGPVGTSAGIVLFVAGIVLTCFYISGVILILAGAFTGFSFSGTVIDSDHKRIRFVNYLFGFIPVGKWVRIEPTMTIGLKESNQTYTAYSQGNRPLDVDKRDFRLILYDSGNKEIMPVKKFKSHDQAKAELDTLRNQLGLKKA